MVWPQNRLAEGTVRWREEEDLRLQEEVGT